MPAYSGGNRWVGVVSGAEPPPPPALAAMRAEFDSEAVQVGPGTWMEIAYLRRVWGRQAARLRRRLESPDRPEASDRRDKERLLVLERGLALLAARHPRLPGEVVAMLLPWAVPVTTQDVPSSPNTVGGNVALELSNGRRLVADDVRQALRELGRAYHYAGRQAEADTCRSLVSELRKGRSVTLDATTLAALQQAFR